MRARICSVISCAMFARVVQLKLRGARNYRLAPLTRAARTRHALLLATNSCTPRRFGRRTARVLLADFCRAFGHSKAREEEKLLYDSSRANNVRPYHVNLKYSMQPKEKIKALSAFSFAIAAAKEKAIKKKSADMRFRALRSTTRALPIDLQAFEKA